MNSYQEKLLNGRLTDRRIDHGNFTEPSAGP